MAAFFTGTLEDIYAFILMLVVTLFIVITVHEWGHYIVARFFGVRVEEFSFGFGKTIFSFGGKEETDTRFYLRAFPIAGYIKLFGDVDPHNPQMWDKQEEKVRPFTEREKTYAYYMKPAWQRFLIVAAGPLINMLLTVLIVVGVYISLGQRSTTIIIDTIGVNTPAYHSDIQLGDEIIAMDGEKNRRMEDIYDYTWYELPPKPHTYTVIRDGEELEITFTALERQYETDRGLKMHHGQTGMLHLGIINIEKDIKTINGINVSKQPNKTRELIQDNFDKEMAVGLSSYVDGQEEIPDPYIMIFPARYNTHFNDTDHKYYDFVFLSDPEDKLFVRLPLFEAIGRTAFLLKEGINKSFKLLHAAFKGKNDDQVVAGFGKMSETVGKAVKAGPYDYIMIIASFSFMIAIVNILPIPALDGGYLVFLLYEIVMGKAVSSRFQTISIITGLVILLGIMIFANISDLLAFVSDK